MATQFVRERLIRQQLVRPRFRDAADLVAWMGAVQAQDYPAAAWNVAQRLRGGTAASIDAAIESGAIVRTHILRPTWHFVPRADLHWMLRLTAPRIRATLGYGDRHSSIDAATLTRTRRILERALAGRMLTRAEIGRALQAGGVPPGDSVRLGRLLAHAELDALISSGSRRGGHHTYALVAERVPDARTLPRDEALSQLTMRYFSSHGPAAVRDFAWWSGLTMADAKRGVEIAGRRLERATHDGQVYFSGVAAPLRSAAGSTCHLLANFDEYTVAYLDRQPACGMPSSHPLARLLLGNVVIVDGVAVGTWRRTLDGGEVSIHVRLARALKPVRQLIEAAASRFGRFVGKTPAVYAARF